MAENKFYLVNNRSAGVVVYKVMDENIRRYFQPGETKKIAAVELEKLMFQNGGRELLTEYLQIVDEQGTKELNIHTEPEYWLTDKGVIELLTTASLDQFLDALDFAPEGVKDLIKKYSVELPLNDNAKRDALKKATGFDVTKAIEHSIEPKQQETVQPNRRVKSETTVTPGRRTSTNYKVVETK